MIPADFCRIFVAMKQWIPNIITLFNLLCGCIAAVFAFNDDLITAGIFVAAGIFFDFFDGLAARLLKVSSELGGQLDSMADLVTSGLVPGIAMYQAKQQKNPSYLVPFEPKVFEL